MKKFQHELGDDATNDAIRVKLEVSEKAFARLITLGTNGWLMSLDHEHAGLRNFMKTSPDGSPLNAAIETQIKEHLAKAVSKLPGRAQLILSLYYVEELTMQEIADILSVTESRICQIHTRALKRLHSELQNQNRQKPE